eukprot:12978-Eustigmatos_ZCMA.PRE.1
MTGKGHCLLVDGPKEQPQWLRKRLTGALQDHVIHTSPQPPHVQLYTDTHHTCVWLLPQCAFGLSGDTAEQWDGVTVCTQHDGGMKEERR